MSAISSNTKRFLFAAQQAELKTLEQLSSNCELVALVCDVIHEFQKERGVSNVYLASIGEHYPQRRTAQLATSQNAQQNLLALLNQHLLAQHRNIDNPRLLYSITGSLHQLDEIDILRKAVDEHRLTPQESTEAYSELIASLICIVYEAADISGDAQLTEQMLALLNFIQAKEYAGQERAWGAIGFAKTRFSYAICDNLTNLQIAQNKSIDVFLKFAHKQHCSAWFTLTEHTVSQEMIKFRQLIEQLRGGESVAAHISEVWYELATQRMDQMRIIESSLSQQLMKVSDSRISQTKTNIKTRPPCPDFDLHISTSQTSALANFHIPEDQFLKKSIYDLLMKQAQRIEDMSTELSAAKKSIAEQKVLGRAKLLLIEQLKLSETQAHQRIQKAAMNQGISLVAVAQNVIDATTGKQPINVS